MLLVSSAACAAVASVHAGMSRCHSYPSPVTQMQYVPEFCGVLSVSLDATLKLFDPDTLAQLQVFAGHYKGVTCFSASRTQGLVVSGSIDHTHPACGIFIPASTWLRSWGTQARCSQCVSTTASLPVHRMRRNSRSCESCERMRNAHAHGAESFDRCAQAAHRTAVSTAGFHIARLSLAI